MKIALFSFKNHDVTEGVSKLIEKYKNNNPSILIPVRAEQEEFVQSVLTVSIKNKIPVTCFFENAVGLDHLLKQANDISLSENPVKDVMRNLEPGDAMGMVWDDSPGAHIILHSLEDFALDTWDITEGLDPIETDEDVFGLSEEMIHEEMTATMGKMIDLMCAFVASTVMKSLSQAVAEHIMNAEEEENKEIDPFKDLG